jgi:hypothetical protein
MGRSTRNNPSKSFDAKADVSVVVNATSSKSKKFTDDDVAAMDVELEVPVQKGKDGKAKDWEGKRGCTSTTTSSAVDQTSASHEDLS